MNKGAMVTFVIQHQNFSTKGRNDPTDAKQKGQPCPVS